MLNIDAITHKLLPGLQHKPPLLRRSLQAILRILFHEKELSRFQANYPQLSGFDFVDQLLEHFDFAYTLRGNERERIPSRGRVVIIANHPIGTLDAAILIQLVSEIRRDVKAVSNQLLEGIQSLAPLLLPVDNMGGRSSRSQLKSVYQHLDEEGAVIIFPAGEVSRMSPSGIRDGRWNSGFLRIATATRAPILPIYIDGRNSMFFYALSLCSRPLSTLWLVREMFKQASRSVHISIGNPIPFDSYQRAHLPLKSCVKLFQRHLYRIGKQKEPVFATSRAVAHPENRQLLRTETHACELLGQTADGKQIYLFDFNPDSCIMSLHPEYRYLFGPVSISDNYPVAARDMLVYFYSLYFPADQSTAKARLPYLLSKETSRTMQDIFPGDDQKCDYLTLKSRMRHLGCSVPTLFKQYGELCEPGGVRFLDFNIDPDFSNCTDGLVVVDLDLLKPAKRKRYIPT